LPLKHKVNEKETAKVLNSGLKDMCDHLNAVKEADRTEEQISE